jgi:hypothetical protein
VFVVVLLGLPLLGRPHAVRATLRLLVRPFRRPTQVGGTGDRTTSADSHRG